MFFGTPIMLIIAVLLRTALAQDTTDPSLHIVPPPSAPTPTSTAPDPWETAGCNSTQGWCGNLGCYDSSKLHCCTYGQLEHAILCPIDADCIFKKNESDALNFYGCCPGGHKFCGDKCIDGAVYKCCQNPQLKFGMCKLKETCCGDSGCCNEGEVCADGTDGPKCWPRGVNTLDQMPSTLAAPTVMEVSTTAATTRPGTKSTSAAWRRTALWSGDSSAWAGYGMVYIGVVFAVAVFARLLG